MIRSPRNPMQPLVVDDHGTIRFKANPIVQHLLDASGITLNDLVGRPFAKDDWTQFYQLIGYSVSGAGELRKFRRKVIERADRKADELRGAAK